MSDEEFKNRIDKIWGEPPLPTPAKLAPLPQPEPSPPKQPKTVKAIVRATHRGNPNWYKGMPSNNPNGRTPGITERKKYLTEKLMDNVNGIMDVMIAKALEGDAAAATLVVSRVVPTVKPQMETVEFTLDADGKISTQVQQVLTAIAQGRVAPDVGKKIIETISTLANVRAVEELEARILVLESKPNVDQGRSTTGHHQDLRGGNGHSPQGPLSFKGGLSTDASSPTERDEG